MPSEGPEEPKRVGRFVVERRLGSGGMGVVYEARDPSLDRRVALKLMQKEAMGDPERRARFVREAKAAAAITDARVATIYEVGESEGEIYIAMEFVEGEPLTDRICAGRLPWREAARIVLDVSRGVAKAHEKKIVHRDLKPGNVIVTPTGEAKVLDFGLAFRATDEPVEGDQESASTVTGGLTQEGAVIGTAPYMSPEQIRGRAVDVRSDVFSIGVILYELLTGERPFRGRTMSDLIVAIASEPHPGLPKAASVPADLSAVVDRCLEKDREARFGSAAELADALARVLARPEESAQRAPVTDARREPRLSSRRVVFSGVALAVAASLGIYAYRASKPEPRPASAASGAPAASSAPARYVEEPRTKNPEAAVAFRNGEQAMRRGMRSQARAELRRALTLDPSLAAAYLRLSLIDRIWNPSDARAALAKASSLRESLSEHDRFLFDSLVARLQRDPQDLEECERTLRTGTERFPTSDLLGREYAFALYEQGKLEQAVHEFDRLLKVDPESPFEGIRAEALAYLGRTSEAIAATDRCLKRAPGARSCAGIRTEIEIAGTDCGRLENVTKAWIAADPVEPDPHAGLASAQFSLGLPTEAIEMTISQGASKRGDGEKWVEAGHSVALAVLVGDFALADKRLGALDELVAKVPEQEAHAAAARLRVGLARETGQPAEAARVAEAFLRKRDGLLADPRAEDFAIAKDATGAMLGAMYATGRLTRAEYASRRGAWIDSWTKRAGAFNSRFVWLQAYPSWVTTSDDAKEALAAIPEGGFPPFHPLAHVDGQVGHVYHLAGRVDEALPYLERGANGCYALFAPFSYYEANLFYGRALEEKRDTDGACRAYGKILEHWGDARPKSVTADAARARAKELRCPAPATSAQQRKP